MADTREYSKTARSTINRLKQRGRKTYNYISGYANFTGLKVYTMKTLFTRSSTLRLPFTFHSFLALSMMILSQRSFP